MTISRPAKPLALERLDELRTILRRRPLALLFDIDGTISDIAPTPAAATVTLKSKALLQKLAARVDLVAAVSGRPVEVARKLVGLSSIAYIGCHGLERWERGRLRLARGAARYRPAIGEALQDLQRRLPYDGLYFEDKGLTANVHYRLSPSPVKARQAVLKAIRESPSASQLLVREGKKVVELRPPVRVHKGIAMKALLRERGVRGALYVGDDRTDVDAFIALHQLKRDGDFSGAAIAAMSKETPSEVIEAADYVVHGVKGVEEVFAWMVEELPGTMPVKADKGQRT